MNTPAPHPGVLTLPSAEVYVRVMVSPSEPYQLDVVVKPIRNLDETLLSLCVSTFARSVRVLQAPSSTVPDLWIGGLCIPLHRPDLPDHAQAWCDRYRDWLRSGDLPQRGAA